MSCEVDDKTFRKNSVYGINCTLFEKFQFNCTNYLHQYNDFIVDQGLN